MVLNDVGAQTRLTGPPYSLYSSYAAFFTLHCKLCIHEAASCVSIDCQVLAESEFYPQVLRRGSDNSRVRDGIAPEPQHRLDIAIVL
jgi:hypothetical protein